MCKCGHTSEQHRPPDHFHKNRACKMGMQGCVCQNYTSIVKEEEEEEEEEDAKETPSKPKSSITPK